MMQTVMSAAGGGPPMNGMMGMPPMPPMSGMPPMPGMPGMDPSMMMNGFGGGPGGPMSQPPGMAGMMGMSNPMADMAGPNPGMSVPPSEVGDGRTPAMPYPGEMDDPSGQVFDPSMGMQGYADQGFNGVSHPFPSREGR